VLRKRRRGIGRFMAPGTGGGGGDDVSVQVMGWGNASAEG
jgi:hypothetical protein